MVNILEAVKGAILNYGTASMETDRILKDWMASSTLQVPASHGEETKWGKFLMIGSVHKQLANDIAILKSVEGDFEKFMKALRPRSQEEWTFTKWLEISSHMAEAGKLLNQADNQRLLGLALSTTYGRPLRYCIQYEVAPSASYWSYYADQLDSCSPTQMKNNIAVVVVGSSNPVLSVSRAVAPLVAKGMNIILVAENDQAALPCLLIGELLNKAGLNCSVYAGSSERLKEITAVDDIDVVLCGSYDQAVTLRNGSSNLKLDLDGKKAVVVMESGDCDAAVDAALTSLKTSSYMSPGFYLVVQDSMLEEVDWRLKERFISSRSGELLDKTIDFTVDARFPCPSKVTEYFQTTKLDILTVGNARVVFNAQPSMPLTQWDQLGQTLLVFSYRSAAELLTLLGNLSGISEISLWCEQQSVALHIVNQIQVPRIWVNGFSSYEPGFDHLLPIKESKCEKFIIVEGGKANTSLYPILDGLRSAQRSWAIQGNRNVFVIKFLKQLLVQDSFSTKTDLLLELIIASSRDMGKVAISSAKRGVVFELTDAVGLVAVVASDGDRLDSLVRIITLALLKGNAIMLCNVQNDIALTLVKIAKDVGLPNVILTCTLNDENNRALLNHHGVRMLVLCGDVSLPSQPGHHVKKILEVDAHWNWTGDNFVVHKWVWMATGEGLAN
ncbi:betaine aldehyde dehydrogenase-like [Daphnia carinata]|uniref:betaine aldehyde dehydrogenase-like n=1 Tax=Daphnia carinata TaxID=120202 RepID=UPI0025794E38|nr:betaine aldehyde dehydrogenase-like [Daphnia carinata]